MILRQKVLINGTRQDSFHLPREMSMRTRNSPVIFPRLRLQNKKSWIKICRMRRAAIHRFWLPQAELME
jgi:hypothetical protein